MIRSMQTLPKKIQADDTVAGNPPDPATLRGSRPTSVSSHKEVEPVKAGDELEPLEEVASEVEVSPELQAIGVEKYSERVDLPPDVVKMGVTASGPGQPVQPAQVVVLPLTDEEINQGLHASILSSLRWLAEWCVRQLKKSRLLRS